MIQQNSGLNLTFNLSEQVVGVTFPDNLVFHSVLSVDLPCWNVFGGREIIRLKAENEGQPNLHQSVSAMLRKRRWPRRK